MTCRGATCGTINMSIANSFVTSNSFILEPKWKIKNKFIELLFNSLDKDQLLSGTAQPQITLTSFKQFPIPLPPLNEQKRIVNKVSPMLDKIEQAKELINQAEKSFEERKAAILVKAFRGELTEQWRKKNDDVELDREIINNVQVQNRELDSYEAPYNLPKSWCWGKLNNLFSKKLRNGYSPKSTNEVTATKALKLSATTQGYFKEDEYKYVIEEIPEDSPYWLKNGDFLIQRGNSLKYVGTTALYTGKDNKYIFPDLMMRARIDEGIIIPQLIVRWANSHSGRKYFMNNATGTAGNMPKINQKVVKNLPVPLMPREEQKKLVEILNPILVKQQQVQEKIEKTKEKIDELEKVILAKAFRGELGTNNPKEESALELLKEILQENL